MDAFLRELHKQRWDDHRYYHHCRINQSLHLISALTFILAYGVVWVDPSLAALLAWGISMTTRQAGHFFFEPREYDMLNQATDEHKEAIKVGYNIRRKVVLMSVWASIPAVLMLSPDLGGWIEPASDWRSTVHDIGLGWLALGIAGLVVRVGQLWVQDSLFTGMVWATKIITDPFNDAWQYRGAPLALLRGERYDPMLSVQDALQQRRLESHR